MNKEIWKDIRGYEGLYQVSNLGKIKSLNRVIRMKHKSGQIMSVRKHGRLVTATDNGSGYLIVGLSKNNKRVNYYVHRLVAAAFISNSQQKTQVNHIDGNKHNNTIANLEWVTPHENQVHSSKILKTQYNITGLIKNREKQKKSVSAFDKNGNLVASFNSVSDAARYMKVTPSCISGCCKGVYKTIKGYIWVYKKKE